MKFEVEVKQEDILDFEHFCLGMGIDLKRI